MKTAIEKEYGDVKLVRLSADTGEQIKYHFEVSAKNMAGRWYPGCGFDRSLKPDWWGAVESSTSVFAPVMAFFDGSDGNILCIGCSEARETVKITAGIVEENGMLSCTIEISSDFLTAEVDGEVVIRISQRRQPVYDAIREVVFWWEKSGMPPGKSVGAAEQAMYSSWYSFHQKISDTVLEEECKEAARLGLKTIIVDDGWQTGDVDRGYGYCGDWEPDPIKFPDFPSHVRKIHELGMKYILWFSVPFVGKYSKNWKKMKDKILCYLPKMEAGVLDIRYPQTREFLINTYEKAVCEWGADGLKLDFIDEFYFREGQDNSVKEGMDIYSIYEAVDVLLAKTVERLRKHKADVLLEFRQRYVGPNMRRYGNMLRVDDCPMSAFTNKVGIADLRLTSADTAVHSDMLMWRSDADAYEVAHQMQSCLFGVMQISVNLSLQNEEQRETMKFWLEFSRKYRDVLLKGKFLPKDMLHLYPSISAQTGGCRITVSYAENTVLEMTAPVREDIFIQSAKQNGLFIKGEARFEAAEIYDCQGRFIKNTGKIFNGISWIEVPAGGLLICKR